MQETRVQLLGGEDPLDKERATHSSILAWEIPETEEPGGLQSTGPQRAGHEFATKHISANDKLNRTFLFLNEESGFLLKENHGTFLYLRVARKIMVPTRIFTQWQGKLFLY